MKYSCYQDCSEIHGWFVYCAFCWQMHRLSKSLEIRFRMASFSRAYSLALAWGIRGLKSLKRFWNTWWPSEAASRLVSLSNYCLGCVFFFSVSWSRAYGLRGLSLYTSNDLTYNSIRFKKPLDIFWPQIQTKGSEDYLVMILAVNRKLWAIFLPRVHLEKEQTPGSPLKT